MADQPRVAIIGGGLGGLCLAQGIGRYEAEMRDYGFAAVRASREAETRYRRG